MRKLFIPEIKFTYSRVYDSHWLEHYKILGKTKEYPTTEQILERVEKVKSFWSDKGNDILKKIASISKLNWQVTYIPVYVVGRTIPFSHPLTIGYKTRAGSDVFSDRIDTLVHELLHVLLVQNNWSNFKNLRKLLYDYKDVKSPNI